MSKETKVKNKLKQKLIDYKKKQFDKAYGELENSVELFEAKITEGIVEELCEVIDQLDEPEVLSQEWIDSKKLGIRNRIPFHMDVDYAVPEEDLKNLLVPKQELPTIPKFVADHIEHEKNIGRPLFTHLDGVHKNPDTKKKEFEWYHANTAKYLRAWLDGYEVEKEHKYYVEINGHYLSQGAKKLFLHEGKPTILKHTFNEQEIKDYDPRYWAFRKPVEEIEK